VREREVRLNNGTQGQMGGIVPEFKTEMQLTMYFKIARRV
jgi:hypothetical protein